MTTLAVKTYDEEESPDQAAFERWCDETDARWAKAWAEGKVAHRHSDPCANPNCPQYREVTK